MRYSLPYTSTPTLGQWYHVVGTYDSSTEYFRLYLNGVEVANYHYTGFGLLGGTTTAAAIGSYYGGAHAFSGAIDEVRIYNRALSSGEVVNLYHSNLAKYDTTKWLFTTSRSGTSILSNIAYSGQVIDLATNSS